ncbi:PufQ cytochrome subunit [Palleronia aestuarii]|uniref:PufQ cytochrome subunit n=1 Tax=Palleronia aestuarii TaxID=568105 RepID=A0A2W7MTU9_9RHOB|nr:cytochrome PufQ [Palleronia aestuarii]PZX11418.1 PufQ cytochrome subunit [Palleronia aestuarii]
MSDMTNGMAPFAVSSRTARRSRAEFAIYFAIILLATLPLATLTWALTALRTLRLPERGPLARAWSQARIITPMIFAA